MYLQHRGENKRNDIPRMVRGSSGFIECIWPDGFKWISEVPNSDFPEGGTKKEKKGKKAAKDSSLSPSMTSK